MMTDRLPILENTPLFTVFALLVLAFVVWRIRDPDFRQIQRLHFDMAAVLFWGVLTTILILSVWDSYYTHFAPPSYKILAPLVSILVYPLWSLALRWLAIRLPGSPAANFCLLDGLQAFFEHVVAIYGLPYLICSFQS
jgi:hypothetical protein